MARDRSVKRARAHTPDDAPLDRSLVATIRSVVTDLDERKRSRRLVIPTVRQRIVGSASETSLDRAYKVMDDVVRTLTKFDQPPYKRYLMQIRLSLRIVSTLASFIFGADYTTNQRAIMKRYRFTTTATHVFASTPRRFGKSETAGMTIAALLVCVPNIRIMIIANSKKAAGNDGLLGIVKKYVRVIYDGVPITNNEEHLVLRFGGNDVREVRAFTSSDSLRYVPLSRPRSLLLASSCRGFNKSVSNQTFGRSLRRKWPFQ
jgi:hypothetical protein